MWAGYVGWLCGLDVYILLLYTTLPDLIGPRRGTHPCQVRITSLERYLHTYPGTGLSTGYWAVLPVLPVLAGRTGCPYWLPVLGDRTDCTIMVMLVLVTSI